MRSSTGPRAFVDSPGETLWTTGGRARPPATHSVSAGSAGVPSAASPYLATLLSASPPGARRDIYLIQAEPGEPRRSLPHLSGTTEHVVLVAGEALIGPSDTPEHLHPGDYLSYAGDEPHVFEALAPGTSAVLISEQR